MPRVCSICVHRRRDEIDSALLTGEPLRDIAGRVPVAKSALHRHKGHLPATLVKARQAQEMARADGLAAELGTLASEARRLQAAAEAAGDLRTAIAALRELTRLIELRARVAGELKDSQINILNVSLDEATARRMAETYLARRGHD